MVNQTKKINSAATLEQNRKISIENGICICDSTDTVTLFFDLIDNEVIVQELYDELNQIIEEYYESIIASEDEVLSEVEGAHFLKKMGIVKTFASCLKYLSKDRLKSGTSKSKWGLCICL